MRDTMTHRGPDGAGLELFCGGGAGIAHRRLAIVDPSAAGHQPMSYEARRYWLTYNGEIYNAAALRDELRTYGCTFMSSCDAEVVLAAFTIWGEDCVNRFNGMWAFAIWDDEREAMYCSRDRFGIKPFYYIDTDGLFLFASEIRAILASGRCRALPHNEAILHYLRDGLVDGLDETFFSGIKRLPPGHSIWINRDSRSVRRYWQLDSLPREDFEAGRERYCELRETLDTAVRAHMVSDVPVGVALSGGLDSSIVFALASRAAGHPLYTYSAYYEEDGPFDERYYSRLMTERYRAQAVEVSPPMHDFMEQLPRIIWHLEEPPLPHGVYPRWCIARVATQNVKVMLVGQGADELFAGYSAYQDVFMRDLMERGMRLRAIRELFLSQYQLGRSQSLLSLWHLLSGSRVKTGKLTSSNPTPRFCGAALRGLDTEPPLVERPTKGSSRLRQALLYDARYGLLPTLLKYEDKINMAFSIEGRVPFLDKGVADQFRSLSELDLIRYGYGKYALRKSAVGLLPREVLWRRNKWGFPTPYQALLGVRFFKDVRARILDSALYEAGYLDRAVVERHVDEYGRGVNRDSRRVWQWLCLAIWYELHGSLADVSRAVLAQSRRAA